MASIHLRCDLRVRFCRAGRSGLETQAALEGEALVQQEPDIDCFRSYKNLGILTDCLLSSLTTGVITSQAHWIPNKFGTSYSVQMQGKTPQPICRGNGSHLTYRCKILDWKHVCTSQMRSSVVLQAWDGNRQTSPILADFLTLSGGMKILFCSDGILLSNLYKEIQPCPRGPLVRPVWIDTGPRPAEGCTC